MRFTAILAASASLVTLCYAVDPLAFTSWPADISAGKPVTLTWAGGVTDQPVTLTLRKGTSGNLDDVETITAEARNGKFTWTPGDNVKQGHAYAFMLSQGGEKNYSSLLKAGAPVNKPAETATDATTAAATTSATTGASTSQATSAPETTGTSSNTDTASSSMVTTTSGSTTSKPLISSSASGTPSSSPISTEVVTSSVSAESPAATERHRKSHQTGGENIGAAPQLSLELALGAIAAFLFAL